jgi:hypothetical protein
LHHAIVSVRGKGILLEKDVNMAVYGGLYAGLGNASIRAEAGAPELAEKTERTVKATVRLSNDGNSAIRLFGVSSEDLNATFTLDETMLQPAETIAVPMTLIMMVGESTARQFHLMLAISTDKGTIEREITVDLDKKEGPAVVGLFGIGNPAAGDLLLAAVVIAVIAVFAVIALKSGSYQGKESGVTLLAREVQGIPGKKLEEIGKHRKTGEGTTHSGLQEIVDRVRKKHVEKKAAPKGKKKGKKR